MARLSADMSVRQTAMLVRLSTQTVRLRHDNVFASIQGHHKAKLGDKLKAMDIQKGSLVHYLVMAVSLPRLRA